MSVGGRRLGLLAVCLVAACASPLPLNGSDSGIHWEGALRLVHEGDASGRVALEQMAGRPGLIAVGPAANLDGEVTALDGRLLVSRVSAGQVRTEEVTRARATAAAFLVWSQVTQWQAPQPLAGAAATHESLERLVALQARERGIDISRPFVFRLEGVVDSLSYHILTPRLPGATGSGHLSNAKVIERRDTPVTIVGFYSPRHTGVFVHEGSSAHLHVIEQDGATGHVDRVSAGPRMRLSVPVPGSGSSR